MDYPKSDSTVGLVSGKFSDGDPANGIGASRDPAAWMNAITEEVLNVIKESGNTPDETNLTQLRDAILILASETGAQQNLNAVVDPTPADDSSEGYSIGSLWINTASGVAFRCVNPAGGAAVWTTNIDENPGDARYARIAAANDFVGDQTVNGNVTGTVIRANKFIDVDGFDLVDLFEPRQSGDPAVANTGFQDSSQSNNDLAAIYAPLSVGSAINHNTMFEIAGGQDLTAIFAQKGSRPSTPLSATIPTSLNAVTNAYNGNASTNVSCSPAGGSGGYTYQWVVVSGSATITNPTSQACTVTEGVPGYSSIQSTIKCVVKDSSGTIVDSNNCVVTFKYVSATPLSASIPSSLNAYTTASGGTASAPCACTASNGTGGGYTYQWVLVSGTATISNATSQTCTVSEAVPGTGSIQSTIKCVVKDASGASADSNDCTITFAYSSGSGGGGGCVEADSWILMADGTYKQARYIKRGDLLYAWREGVALGPVPVQNDPTIQLQPGMAIKAGFWRLRCSLSTPFDLRRGGSVTGAEIHRRKVLTRWFGWRKARVTHVGDIEVVMISLGGLSFAAGARKGRWIVSHNTYKK